MLTIVDGGTNLAENSNRIAWLDIGRGSSILLVIFFHASMLIQDTGNLHPVHWIINDFFAPIRMPLFFTISGVLGAKALKAGWPQIVEKRVLLLWYVYILWAAIAMVMEFIIGNKASFGDLASMAIWPSSTLWYLWVLGLYFVVARVFTGRMQLPVLFLATVTSVLAESKYFEIASLEHFKAIVYAPFFLGGAWYGHALLRMLTRPWITFIVAASSFALLFFMLRWNILPPGVGVAASVFGLTSGMAGSILLGRVRWVGSALAYFGRNTLPVYVSHFLLLRFCVFLFATFGVVTLPGFSNWGALVTSCAALGLALSIGRIAADYNASWLFKLPSVVVTRLGPIWQPYPSRVPAIRR